MNENGIEVSVHDSIYFLTLVSIATKGVGYIKKIPW